MFTDNYNFNFNEIFKNNDKKCIEYCVENCFSNLDLNTNGCILAYGPKKSGKCKF